MANITLDPEYVKWIQEWIKHQQLMVEVQNLGNPVFKLPLGPQPWDMPIALLLGSIDRESLRELARGQLEQQIGQIERQIEQLENVKERYEGLREAL